MNSSPIFSPFVMDGLTRRGRMKSVPMVALPKGLLYTEHAERPPRPAILRQPKSEYGSRLVSMKMAPRRPRGAVGNGEPLGKSSLPETSFRKTALLIPPRVVKRSYFEEIGDHPTFAEPKMPKHFMEEGEGEPGPSSSRHAHDDYHATNFEDNDIVHTEVASSQEVVREPEEDELRVDDLGAQDETALLDQSEGREPIITQRLPIDIQGKLRNAPPIFKQLAGENAWLKEQLDSAIYRNKQLEMILLDRNIRIKDLVRENLQMSCKMKRLIVGVGEETAEEILAPPPSSSKNGRLTRR